MPENENPATRKPRQKTAAKKTEETPLCHIHDEVRKDHINDVRSNVCFNEEPTTEFEGKYYCIFHLPNKKKNFDGKFDEKLDERLKAIEAKIAATEKLPKDKKEDALSKLAYDFRYIWFPSELSFEHYEFKTNVSFYHATFMSYVNFLGSVFTADANFNRAIFEDKSFGYFVNCKFSKTLFFNQTHFKGYVVFESIGNNYLFIGKNALLDLRSARVEDAKKIKFRNVRLEPSWFIVSDPSEFVFTGCNWVEADGIRLRVKNQLKKVKKRNFSNPSALLTKACWQLAENYEESKSFAEASMFREFAQESRRLENPWYKQPFTLHWWYYAVSFYGERWTRAFFMLLGILVLFGLLYAAPVSQFDYAANAPKAAETPVTRACDYLRLSGETNPMTVCDGIVHSLAVASFQRPDPKPKDVLTKFLITLETILAPLQAALLALAIRRKFIR